MEKVKSSEKLLANREQWKHQFRGMNNDRAPGIHWSDENEKQQPIVGVRITFSAGEKLHNIPSTMAITHITMMLRV